MKTGLSTVFIITYKVTENIKLIGDVWFLCVIPMHDRGMTTVKRGKHLFLNKNWMSPRRFIKKKSSEVIIYFARLLRDSKNKVIRGTLLNLAKAHVALRRCVDDCLMLVPFAVTQCSNSNWVVRARGIGATIPVLQ